MKPEPKVEWSPPFAANESLEELLTRDLNAWIEAKAAIARACSL
jgi:hypothetical protein